MNTRIAALSILAAATLAACAPNTTTVRPSLEPSARIATQPVAYRPGTGVIQSVTPAPVMGTAVAGGSAVTNRPEAPVGTEANRSAAGQMQRLAIKMDAGGDIQYVDTDATQFQRGMRIELTPDHFIRQL
jgi:outer membrane lipoprotein SlyB